MEKQEIDLLEAYIAKGDAEARKNAQLAELCDVADEIRALYPPPPRAELMEQTVERIVDSLSARQGIRGIYRRWFINTGWASAAVAAVLLVTMGVLPHRSGDYVPPPVPLTGQNAPLDSRQPAVPSPPSALLPVPPGQSAVPAPPEAAMPAPAAEKAAAPRPVEDAAPRQKTAQTLPGGNPPPAPADDARRTESGKDSGQRPVLFKSFAFMAPGDSVAADETGEAPGTKGSLHAQGALTGKSGAVPFKVLTVPGRTPVRTEVSNDEPPGVTMVYNVGKTEILVRQWLRTATEPLGPETDPGRTVRLYRGDVAVEVSGDADLRELKQFAEQLQ